MLIFQKFYHLNLDTLDFSNWRTSKVYSHQLLLLHCRQREGINESFFLHQNYLIFLLFLLKFSISSSWITCWWFVYFFIIDCCIWMTKSYTLFCSYRLCYLCVVVVWTKSQWHKPIDYDMSRTWQRVKDGNKSILLFVVLFGYFSICYLLLGLIQIGYFSYTQNNRTRSIIIQTDPNLLITRTGSIPPHPKTQKSESLDPNPNEYPNAYAYYSLLHFEAGNELVLEKYLLQN